MISTKKKNGFTLLELIVTVAVMGLLAGLMLTALGRARESARRAQCANNLRQHGIAWYLYLDDHGDLFPMWDATPKNGGSNHRSFGGKLGIGDASDDYGQGYRILNPYLDIYAGYGQNLEIFKCPDDRTGCGYPGNETTTSFDLWGNSYVANGAILMYGFPLYKRRPLSTITSPSNKVYLEYCDEWNGPGHGRQGYTQGAHIPVMILFLDGHVAGPFNFSSNWDADFELYLADTGRPVIYDPNGTSSSSD